RPFCTSPYRVHCDTTRSAPPPGTSARPRFIFPAASPNTRRPRILSAIHASASSVSVGANPASTRRPGPMLPETLPSIRTAARETRWRTTLTGRLWTLVEEGGGWWRSLRLAAQPPPCSTIFHNPPPSSILHHPPAHSTVTLFARFLGWSTLQPRLTAM